MECRRHRQRGQAWAKLARAGGADGDGVNDQFKIGGTDGIQRRRNQDVGFFQRLQRYPHILLGENVEHLQGHAENGLQFVALQQGRADIDRDDDIRAHLPHDIHRQIARQPAVEKYLVADLVGRDRARHRHRGAHRIAEPAAIEHHHAPGLRIGGDRAKRDRQFVEHHLARGVAREQGKQAVEFLSGDGARRQAQTAVLHADFKFEQTRQVFLLAQEAAVGPGAGVGEQIVPVRVGKPLFKLATRGAGGIGRADECAHTGAGDIVDRDVQFLKDLDHTHMGRATRAAAGQHQADFGTPFFSGCIGRHLCKNRRVDEHREEGEEDGNAESAVAEWE